MLPLSLIFLLPLARFQWLFALQPTSQLLNVPPVLQLSVLADAAFPAILGFALLRPTVQGTLLRQCNVQVPIVLCLTYLTSHCPGTRMTLEVEINENFSHMMSRVGRLARSDGEDSAFG